MPPLAQIQSLPQAHHIIKQLGLRPQELADELRLEARRALADVLNDRMNRFIDTYLEDIGERDIDDRRNGSYSRHFLSELGDLILEVPRTRTTSAAWLLGRYARRAAELDRTILACFLLGLSTRKVAKALLPILGERFSPTLVSNLSKSLDTAVAAFHRRSLHARYRVVLLDGVVLSRKTGAGSIKRPVLVALGILPDGRKEVIDFRVAASESEREWEIFLSDLRQRGLTEEGLELIGIDGCAGLRAALDMVYPTVAVQRCWAHKMRNLTDKVRVGDHQQVKRDLQKVYRARNVAAARQAAHAFVQRWRAVYPQAVKSLRNDLDELLAFFRFKETSWRKAARTTNAIERRFREVRRRTRPMGVMADRTSMERILFAVFSYENQQQGVAPLFSLTQIN